MILNETKVIPTEPHRGNRWSLVAKEKRREEAQGSSYWLIQAVPLSLNVTQQLGLNGLLPPAVSVLRCSLQALDLRLGE